MPYKTTKGGTDRRREAILAVAAIMLQLTVAPQLTIAGGRINFMLILTVVFSLGGGDARRAICAGFASGMLYDLTAPVPVGLMALLLTVASFALARASTSMRRALSPGSVRLVAVCALVVSLAYGLLLLLMGRATDALVALIGHGLSSAILDTVAAIPFLLLAGSPRDQRGPVMAAKGTRFREKH